VRADDRRQAAQFGNDQFNLGYGEAITQTMQRIESMPFVVITKASVLAAIKEL
jgi:hypothetical protein